METYATQYTHAVADPKGWQQWSHPSAAEKYSPEAIREGLRTTSSRASGRELDTVSSRIPIEFKGSSIHGKQRSGLRGVHRLDQVTDKERAWARFIQRPIETKMDFFRTEQLRPNIEVGGDYNQYLVSEYGMHLTADPYRHPVQIMQDSIRERLNPANAVSREDLSRRYLLQDDLVSQNLDKQRLAEAAVKQMASMDQTQMISAGNQHDPFYRRDDVADTVRVRYPVRFHEPRRRGGGGDRYEGDGDDRSIRSGSTAESGGPPPPPATPSTSHDAVGARSTTSSAITHVSSQVGTQGLEPERQEPLTLSTPTITGFSVTSSRGQTNDPPASTALVEHHRAYLGPSERIQGINPMISGVNTTNSTNSGSSAQSFIGETTHRTGRVSLDSNITEEPFYTPDVPSRRNSMSTADRWRLSEPLTPDKEIAAAKRLMETFPDSVLQKRLARKFNLTPRISENTKREVNDVLVNARTRTAKKLIKQIKSSHQKGKRYSLSPVQHRSLLGDMEAESLTPMKAKISKKKTFYRSPVMTRSRTNLKKR